MADTVAALFTRQRIDLQIFVKEQLTENERVDNWAWAHRDSQHLPK